MTLKRLCLIGCALTLSACSTPDVVFLTPEIDPDLRQTCSIPERDTANFGDLALIVGDHVEALDCANGRIAAIDETLIEFDKLVAESE